MKKLVKLIFFISIFLISSCSNISKNIDNASIQNNIEILSDIPGIGNKIKNHYKITTHYVGTLEDGTVFDSSYERNKPFTFQIGLEQVIPGLEMGLLGMQVGGKRIFKIPPSLAYGKSGVGKIIPPYAKLIFEVEIINIQPPGYKEITPEQLLLLKKEKLFVLQKINLVLIDIRTQNEQNMTGIIHNSYQITAFNKKGNLNNKFLDNYKSIVKESDHVVFISDRGEISAILANGFVENLGKKNIYSLKGGIQEWIIKGNKINI